MGPLSRYAIRTLQNRPSETVEAFVVWELLDTPPTRFRHFSCYPAEEPADYSKVYVVACRACVGICQ